MSGEGITPPQGYGNGPDKSKYFYGLPLSMPTGGAGTKIAVTIRNPEMIRSGGGTKVAITGDLGPYTPPPIVESPSFYMKNGAGTKIMTISPMAQIKTAGGGTRAFITDPPIVVKSGGGTAAMNQGL